MRGTATYRQRRKKLIFLLLLLPLVGAGIWAGLAILGFQSGDRQAGISGGTLVESSSLRRNNIYDRNFDTLALSFRLSSLYVRPLEITDPEGTAAELARILDLDQEQLLASFRSERSFVWLTRQAERDLVDRVLEGDFRGVHVMPRSHRYYPHQTGASHAIGFVKDEQGLAGIELSYDNILRGGISDIRLAAAGVPERVAASGGVHLVSTLDLPLQRELENRLARALRAVDGVSASALVMDVASGALVGMASLPSYDPNHFWAARAEERLNRAVVPQVRPGALRSLFILAAAHEKGVAGTSPPGADQLESQGFWYEMDREIYASSSLRPAGATGELMSPPESFWRRIGLCAGIDLDLLEGRSLNEGMSSPDGLEDECRQLLLAEDPVVSGVALLAAFSRLVNGGQPVEPHLIRGFWDTEQFWPRKSALNGDVFPAVAGRNFLRDLVPAGEDSVPVATYESLVTLRPEHRTEAGSPAAERATTENDTPADGRYQAVMLGMAPAEDPGLAALVFIDGAKMDLALPSPLRGVVRDLDTWATNLRRPVTVPTGATVMARESTLLQQWAAMQEKGEGPTQVAAIRPVERMPDVMGLSLRKALQTLQNSGLRIKVQGSGRVVGQKPPPGASLKGVDEGTIELRVITGNLAAANNLRSKNGR